MIPYIIYDTPDCGLPNQRRPGSLNEAVDGDADDEENVEPDWNTESVIFFWETDANSLHNLCSEGEGLPVDIFVPVGLCHGEVGDVRLLRVVVSIPIGLRRL